VLALSFLVRFLLFPVPGYQVDLNTFEAWFSTAAQVGPRTFYNVVSFCDYPPFNIYFFWGFGSLAKALLLSGTPQMAYVIKLAPNLFDLATAGLIFAFVRKRLTFNAALLATALYAFNPAVVFTGAVWGQFDAIYTFFLVLSVMLALASKPELSAATFTLSVLTKPQGIALAPLIAYLILRQYRLQWQRLLTSVVAVVVTVFVVIIPFEWSNPVTFLSNIYFGAYSGYEVTSVNAFNLWALGGLWVPDGVLFIVGWVLFGCLAAFTLYVLHKWFTASGELLVLFSAFVLLFAFFMLPTRIHERYLFPAISMLALMFPFIKKTRPLYAILTATLLVNVAYVLYWLNVYAAAGYSYSPNLTGDPVVLAVSLINIVTFMYVLILMWDELKGRSWLQISSAKTAKNSKEAS
jgi:Gpi18-like mannosyltransferase